MSDKRVLRDLKLTRFSAVGNPAQKGAQAVLLKSAGNAAEVETIAGAPAATTANVEQTRKDETLDTEDSTMEKTAEEMAAVQEQLDKANKVIALSADERAHYDGLAGDTADAYLAKSAGDRAADIRAATDSDPVEYTSKATGQVLRKSAGEIVIALAKQVDELAEKNEILTKANEVARLEKRIATEFPNLPNEEGALPQLLKAAEGIGEKAVAILASANTATTGLFKAAGVAGEPVMTEAGADPAETFEKKAEELMKADSLTSAEAIVKFGRTDEGRLLRAQIDARRPAVTAEVQGE